MPCGAISDSSRTAHIERMPLPRLPKIHRQRIRRSALCVEGDIDDRGHHEDVYERWRQREADAATFLSGMRLDNCPGAGNPARLSCRAYRHPGRPEINHASARDILRRRVALGANDRRHAAVCEKGSLSKRKFRSARAPTVFAPAPRPLGLALRGTARQGVGPHKSGRLVLVELPRKISRHPLFRSVPS
jgi:hypothetical protein